MKLWVVYLPERAMEFYSEDEGEDAVLYCRFALASKLSQVLTTNKQIPREGDLVNMTQFDTFLENCDTTANSIGVDPEFFAAQLLNEPEMYVAPVQRIWYYSEELVLALCGLRRVGEILHSPLNDPDHREDPDLQRMYWQFGILIDAVKDETLPTHMPIYKPGESWPEQGSFNVLSPSAKPENWVPKEYADENPREYEPWT